MALDFGVAYQLSDAHFAALLGLSDAKERYGYCIKRIADTGSLYWLESDGGRCLVGPDERGVTTLSIWPHPRFAEDYLARDPVAMASWIGAEPVEIDVHEFLAVEMPMLLVGGCAVAAFPVARGGAAVVTALEYEANLREELARVE